MVPAVPRIDRTTMLVLPEPELWAVPELELRLELAQLPEERAP
jgi:hypothetical protein